MTGDARRVLDDFLSEASDVVCEAIHLFERHEPRQMPTALFALDALLKAEPLREALVAVHGKQDRGHPCCLHAGGAAHTCCLPAVVEATPHSEGDWVLVRPDGEGREVYASSCGAEDRGLVWGPDSTYDKVLRFKERGFAEIFASWHFKGDVTVRATRLEARAA